MSTFFELTDEQHHLRHVLLEFSRQELAPHAADMDRRAEWRWDLWHKLGDMGLLGLPLPEEYGGLGAGALTTAIAMEAVAEGGADAGLLLSWGAHLILCAVPIWKVGNAQQRRTYLPRLASGAWVGAFALTEPEAGSDAASLRTTAKRHGDFYVLNGTKMFITNAPIADVVVVLAVTDPERGREGISAFIVEKGMPGFQVGQVLDKLGHRASPTAELVFTDCQVPAENRLGAEGEGFSTIAKLILEWERGVLMAPTVGHLARLVALAAQYAQERVQFGRPIARFQAIRHKVAEMHVDVEAARLLIYRTAWLKDRDEACPLEAAEGKLVAGQAVVRAALEAIQVHGGYGYLTDYPVERALRDAKLAEIGAGTNEVQRLIIAHETVRGTPSRGYPLSELQREVWQEARRFVAAHIAPHAADVDAGRPLLRHHVRALGEAGYLGVAYPEAHGGAGLDSVTAILVGEAMAWACPATALSAGASVVLCGYPILRFGSDDQRASFLPPLLDGTWLGALAITEPGAGSDVAGIRTRAVRHNGGWVLNGAKTLITNGPVADLVIVLAWTNPDAGPAQGMSTFIVRRDTPGFSAGPPLEKLGVRGSPTSELFFSDCWVPDDMVLAPVGQGFRVVMETLAWGRVNMAAWSVGVAQACLDEAVRYVRERQAFGRPIADFQAVRFKLADMRTAVDTARLLTVRAAWLKDQGRPFGEAAAVAKLYASRAATRCAHEAVQVFGGHGYIRGQAVERLYRDARLAEIGEGTSEIQLNIIAETLFKQQRST
ncbi:MAG: acyl-CoA dehydrogenase family protein [Ardenticatenia bacterium]|nr:acyl-CoA dehydrogenase family protein [Ardenticatenia bacterium]